MEFHTPDKNGRAVSPVIGVILMVAITVILAAVIGAFVLDFGDNPAAAPHPTWDTEETQTASGVTEVTFTHDGGEPVVADRLVVVVDGDRQEITASGSLQTGNSVTVAFSGSNQLDAGDEVRLVWTDGSTEQTVGTHSLTEASDGESIDSVTVS